MNKKEAIERIESTIAYRCSDTFGEALHVATESMKKLMEYEKLERTGKLIRMPDCRNCKHAYRDDTRCYECLANMTCWPNNFEPRKKVKK